MRQAVREWEACRGRWHDPLRAGKLQNLVDDELNRRRIDVRFAITPAEGLPALVQVPRTLGGAIWLQLAEAVAGNTEFRKCRSCDTWFQITPKVSRTNRRYCEDKCKSRYSRLRKIQARELHSKGVRVREIARKLEAKEAVVRGWITPGD